jgi:hypothetical protein
MPYSTEKKSICPLSCINMQGYGIVLVAESHDSTINFIAVNLFFQKGSDMSVDKIASINIQQRTRWQSDLCSFSLLHEAHLMLTAAEHCALTFDWDIIQEEDAFGCALLDMNIWHRAIDRVLAMEFGWDHGISWLEEFTQQLLWKDPWATVWYDAARPLAAKIERRLIWTWLMQRELIENWPGTLDDEQDASKNLDLYLRRQKRGEYLPPRYLDCVIEIRLQKDSMNQPVPVLLTYRKRTPDEYETKTAGVTIEWR